MEIIISSPSFYLHIQDAVIFIQYCIDGIFNIASGVGTTIKELADNIISISELDCELECRYDMELEWDSVCDISKMKSQLNYIPTYSISEGLRLTYNWHKENR